MKIPTQSGLLFLLLGMGSDCWHCSTRKTRHVFIFTFKRKTSSKLNQLCKHAKKYIGKPDWNRNQTVKSQQCPFPSLFFLQIKCVARVVGVKLMELNSFTRSLVTKQKENETSSLPLLVFYY